MDHLRDRISVLNTAFGLELSLFPDRHLVDNTDIVVPENADELPGFVLRGERLLAYHLAERRSRVIGEEILQEEGNERVPFGLDGGALRCRHIGKRRCIRQM